MGRNLLAGLSLATFMVACSSSSGHEPVIRSDAGTGGAGAKDAGAGGAGARDAGDADVGVATDAACVGQVGERPDFALEPVGATGGGGNTSFQGPASVTRTDAGGLELLGGDGARARFGGAIPPVPPGGSLWLQFHSARVGNPFNPKETYDVSVSAAEGAPMLAERLVDYVPAETPSPLRFLGAPMSFSIVCATKAYGLVSRIGEPPSLCFDILYYEVTIHGDTDVTFGVASPGHVRIGTVEYEVWVTGASAMTLIGGPDSFQRCLPADWEPNPGLTISGRAVEYQGLLGGNGTDAGTMDGDSGADAR